MANITQINVNGTTYDLKDNISGYTTAYDGTTTSDTKYDALFLETLASGVDTVKVGLDMDLLWTNSAPTSSFSAQTVSVDLSSYSFAYIVYLQVTSNTSYYDSKLLKIGDNGDMYARLGGYISFRHTTANSNGITFEDGSRQTSFGSNSTDNTRSIPCKIYGIR